MGDPAKEETTGGMTREQMLTWLHEEWGPSFNVRSYCAGGCGRKGDAHDVDDPEFVTPGWTQPETAYPWATASYCPDCQAAREKRMAMFGGG